MKRGEKVGRNAPCPCGSGRKFKRCCEASDRTGGVGGRLILVALLCAIIGAVLLGVVSFNSESNPAGPRRVWSPEHGHYHNVP